MAKSLYFIGSLFLKSFHNSFLSHPPKLIDDKFKIIIFTYRVMTLSL